ncbi:hypothetical protein JX265_010570 [Neoarthrinium moseri]|uniref:Uncharacterized protein n=1 Tax=Neoarthrinium moseri TaxID=1658444 RepID=A0A9Q0ALM8_9PEZI|nr:hypothetical protein JX266_007718 [Neoarthrinium moseri]KAI1859093.1 hypothetical protein JX265_010570 [Neoarthrinium moseri]
MAFAAPAFNNSGFSTPSSVPSGRGRRQTQPGRGPWADGPLPLLETPSLTLDITHPVLHVANEVCQGHNAALRGLNAIFLQAPHVSAANDVADLLFLTKSWAGWVLGQHVQRQTRLFPQFEETLGKPGSITSLYTEELNFEPALHHLLDYSEHTHSRPAAYDSSNFLLLIKGVGNAFRAYVEAQTSILVDLQSLCGQSGSFEAETRSAKILQLYLSSEADIKDHSDPFIVPPMTVRMRDTTYEGGNNWPGLSVLAVHAIADKLSPAHAGAWRFLPCDVWGKPRGLPFLGQDAGKADGFQKVLPAVTPISGASTENLVYMR